MISVTKIQVIEPSCDFPLLECAGNWLENNCATESQASNNNNNNNNNSEHPKWQFNLMGHRASPFGTFI